MPLRHVNGFPILGLLRAAVSQLQQAFPPYLGTSGSPTLSISCCDSVVPYTLALHMTLAGFYDPVTILLSVTGGPGTLNLYRISEGILWINSLPSVTLPLGEQHSSLLLNARRLRAVHSKIRQTVVPDSHSQHSHFIAPRLLP